MADWVAVASDLVKAQTLNTFFSKKKLVTQLMISAVNNPSLKNSTGMKRIYGSMDFQK